MGRYVSYLLDLAGDGDIRTVKASLRFVPDPDIALVPTTAFVWNIVVSDKGEVWVRGVTRGPLMLLAAAQWSAATGDGALIAQRQLDTTNPTGFQWNLIEDSVRDALAKAERAASKPGPTDTIERPRDKELDALTPTDEASAEMQKNLRLNEKAVANAKAAAKTHRQGLTIGFAISAFVIVAIAAPLVYVYRSRGADKVAVPTLPNGDRLSVAIDAQVAIVSTPPSVPADAPSVASPDEAVMTAESLPSAIALSRSAFSVSTSNEVSEGALRLAHFNHIQWSDVDVPAETTLPMIEKDAQAELGKRVCVEGQILTIRRRDLDQPPRPPKKLFVGRLRTQNDDVAFVAVGSTGSLVKLDKARFCGVSTGLANNIPGLAENIPELVGMFDLPETQQPQAEQ
ncbi:hypothetical protein BH11MYX2_BH11MYX2_16010 [soil metagenome]